MITKKQRRRRRRIILLAIVLGFIFIPERTVDAVTDDVSVKIPAEIAEEVVQTSSAQTVAVQTSSDQTDSSQIPNKAKKSSSSFSQQFVDSSGLDTGVGQDAVTHSAADSTKPYYTKDKNGLYDLTGPVIDAANLLNAAQYNQLDSFLRNLDDTTGVQIAVLTVPSLGGVAIEEYSIRHAEKWQLGQKGVDNGALLVASMEEHALRIETGYGTEAALTDAKCSQIIRNVLVPKFRDGKYGEGIIEAVNNMAGIITEDESLVSKSVLSESSSSSDDDSEILYIILGAIILFIIFAAIVGNIGGGSSYSGGSYHSSGHSYSGGGHSYSGGGGHFGGGGASGHW